MAAPTDRPAVAVIGEALIDFVDTGDGRTYDARPGGSPLNVAVGTARLGTATFFLGRFARDHFGGLLRGHAQDNGVDLRAAADVRDAATTLAVATLDEFGQAGYDFYVNGTADWSWTSAELRSLPLGTGIVHAGSLASFLPPGSSAITGLLREVRTARDVLVSYDPNTRASLMGTPPQARPQIESLIAVADLAKASADDLAWLYPELEIEQVARLWLELGVRMVVVTSGGAGATAFTAAATVHRPVPALRVVDTIGAGDAFTSGLLDGIVRAGLARPDRFASACAGPGAETVLADLVDAANVVAAITCTRAGADPPTRREVDDLLERR
ncbi:MAG: PfkB protein [Pseudonocardiales bacterium]|nr:PfkB protein [Pseudonocardiales bacterium]